MRIPTRADLTALLLRPMPYAKRPIPIADTDPDPGLFGPGSVTWEVMAEPLLMLGAGRALLMQAAHPLVAEGAIDHSSYATEPFARFQRTVEWVTVVCFGTTAEARRASRGVNRLHVPVQGSLRRDHATPQVRGGAKYSGRDPELLLWVHATFVDTMLVSHDAFVGGLSTADADTFVREWGAVAALMGVPSSRLWPDRVSLRAYVDEQVASGVVAPGAGSRLVARTVLNPPAPSAQARAAFAVLAFTTVGLLPPAVRSAYRVGWTPAHTAAHAAMRLSIRNLRLVLPERLRRSPVYDLAMDRSAGRSRRGSEIA
ncbi:MAG: oxygenase MpaB family protein [Candidatus Dormibacter sp.]